MLVKVRNGSLTDGDETLLVNASNTEARLGSGVSHAIRLACGPGYQESIVAQMHAKFGGSMAPGDVFITDAGTHPASYVAHVAVMDYRNQGGTPFPNADRIRRGCVGLWAAIGALDASVSVAMVALGGGTGQMGVSTPTEIACETLKAHLESSATPNVDSVTFYGWTLPEYLAMAETVRAAFPDAEPDPNVQTH